MNQNSLRTIMGFALVIIIISFIMLFKLIPSDSGFVPVCLSLGFSSMVFTFSLIASSKLAMEEGKIVPLKYGLVIFYTIIILVIVIRVWIL